MSAIAGGHVHVRPRGMTLAVSADTVAITALAVLAAVLVALTWGAWGDFGRDTGYDVVAGARVAHGDLPYRDFTYYYGPLAPFALGFAAWIGGGGLMPAVVVGLLVALAIVALTYALARCFVGALGSFLAAGIVLGVAVSPTNVSYVLPHTSAMTLGVLALLASLLALARAGKPASARTLVGAGTAAGFVALTKPELEAAVVAAILAWSWVRRPGLRSLALLAAPAIAVPAVVYGAFLTQVGAGTLLFDNLYPRKVLAAGGNAILHAHAPLAAAPLLHHAGHLALYALGVLALVGLARALDSSPRLVRVLAAVAGALALALAFQHLETTRSALQLAYGWIPGGALLAAVILAVRRRNEAAIALAASLAVAGGSTYAAFYFHAPRAQTAVYFAPLAAVFLAGLHLRAVPRSRTAEVLAVGWLAFLVAVGLALAVKDARAESATVHGPGGAIRVAPADAPAYRAAVGSIERLSAPGERILVAPQLSSLYVLTGRRPALRQISLLPGALDGAAGERLAIAQLRAAHVRLVVTDRHPFTEYGHGPFGSSFDRVLGTWITTHFVRVGAYPAQAHTLDIWRRR